MSNWDAIRRELDIWEEQKRTASFWWRDDDAKDVTDRLSRMMKIAQSFNITVGLSVIPLGHKPKLRDFVFSEKNLAVLVHGYAHVNYARARQHKSEIGGERPLPDIVEDLLQGIQISRRAFGQKLLPVMVPPWNQISTRAIQQLPDLGYVGFSTWKPRPIVEAHPLLVQVNTHLDMIDWRHDRKVKDEARIIGLLLRKLRWRRANPVRAQEPLGLLTHHALWSREKEQIVVNMLRTTKTHPAARWISPRVAFGK